MNPHFESAFAALKRASEHMMAAHEEQTAAHAALVEGIRQVLEANNEHLDLRETVERLQTSVLALAEEVKGLRGDSA